MSTRYNQPIHRNMQILRQRSCLKHQPIVLTLTVHGDKTPICINKRFLTICKKLIEPGKSAEIYKDEQFLLTYTCLPNNTRIFNLAQHYGNETFNIRTLTICGELFHIDNHDQSVHVLGFENIAKNMAFREFYIPTLKFETPFALPAIGSKKQAYATIKSMNLMVSVKDAKNNAVIKNMVREGVVACQTANRQNASIASTPSTILNLDTAQRMLWFNSNAVSRIRSLYHYLPVDVAQTTCLNVAIGHASTHPPSSILLAHTFQHAPASKELICALQNEVCDIKPSSVINYLNQQGDKVKVALFKVSDDTQTLLRTHNLDIRHGHPFISIASDGTPILIADLDMNVLPVYESISTPPPTRSKKEDIKGDLRRRMQLYSICVYHHTIKPALHILIRAATSNPHFFPLVCSPGLDIWASTRAIAYE